MIWLLMNLVCLYGVTGLLLLVALYWPGDDTSRWWDLPPDVAECEVVGEIPLPGVTGEVTSRW